MKTSGLLLALFFGIISYSNAQLERVLENTNQAVDLIFHAPRHINLMTVEPLEKKTSTPKAAERKKCRSLRNR